MYEGPQHPAHESRQFDRTGLDHRVKPADVGRVAKVAVFEDLGIARCAVDLAMDLSADVEAALQSHLSDAREIVERHDVADDPDSLVAGYGEVRLDRDPPLVVLLDPQRVSESVHKVDRLYPSGP